MRSHRFSLQTTLRRTRLLLASQWVYCIQLTLSAVSLTAQEPLALLEQQAFKNAVAAVSPSVVQIQTFGGLDRVGEVQAGSGPTTGVILSPDGYLISSAFSFATRPAAVVVKLHDGRQFNADIVATDFSRMLTLLKIEADGLPTFDQASLDEARVGQWTLAIGKVFDVAIPNQSPGILSAKNRMWGKALQTDAKTSPFNYGGPLINLQGQVLGIVVPMSMTNDEAMAGSEWYDSGIGFAVPIDQVTSAAERLRSGDDLYRGTLGVTTSKPGQLFSEPIIDQVREGSAAAAAGLKKGDAIVAIDGEPVARQAEILEALGKRYAGDEVRVTVLRGDERITAPIVLEKPVKTSIMPEQKPAEQPGDDERPADRPTGDATATR